MASKEDISSVQCTNIHNITDSEDASKWLYSSIDKLILQVIIPSVSVVGVVGNCAFLFMIIRLPNMRTSLSIWTKLYASLLDIQNSSNWKIMELFAIFFRGSVWYFVTYMNIDKDRLIILC